MSIVNDAQVIGNSNQNVVLETAGRIYVKVKDRYYELDFRNFGGTGLGVSSEGSEKPLKEQEQQEKPEELTKEYLDGRLLNYVTKRSWQDVKETQKMLENSLLEGFTESISPITINTMQLIVGSEQLQFEWIQALNNPNPDREYAIYIDKYGRLVCPAGVIKHYTLNGPKAVQKEETFGDNLKYYCRWEVKNWDSEDPNDYDTYFNDLVDEDSYYVYIVADKIYASDSDVEAADDEETKKGIWAKTGQASFMISTNAFPLEPDDDPDHYYLLYAMVNSNTDGSGRSISTMNGFTEILPGQITAYIFKSPRGDSYLDLDKNILKLGDRLIYNLDPDSGAQDGALRIRGAILQDDGGNSWPVQVYRGDYIAGETYYYGNTVTYTDSSGATSTYQYISDTSGSGGEHWPEEAPNIWKAVALGVIGKDAAIVTLSTTSLIFTYETRESPTPREDSITLTCNAKNISSPTYVWSYKKSGDSSFTVISGKTSSSLIVYASEIGIYFGNKDACTFRVTVNNDLYDEITINKLYGGSGENGVVTFLTNTSHLFSGTSYGAISGQSDVFYVLLYYGLELQKAGDYTINSSEIEGRITGKLTISVTQAQYPGTSSTVYKITVTPTSTLTQKNGIITIPVHYKGQTIKLVYSWAISFAGGPGIQGPIVRVSEWIGESNNYYNGEDSDPQDKYWLDIVYYNGNYYRCKESYYYSSEIETPPDQDTIHWAQENRFSFIATSVMLIGDGAVGWTINRGQIRHTENKALLDSDGNIYLGNSAEEDPITHEKPQINSENANFYVDGSTGNVSLKGDIRIQKNNSIIMLDENNKVKLSITGKPLSDVISPGIYSFNPTSLYNGTVPLRQEVIVQGSKVPLVTNINIEDPANRVIIPNLDFSVASNLDQSSTSQGGILWNFKVTFYVDGNYSWHDIYSWTQNYYSSSTVFTVPGTTMVITPPGNHTFSASVEIYATPQGGFSGESNFSIAISLNYSDRIRVEYAIEKCEIASNGFRVMYDSNHYAVFKKDGTSMSNVVFEIRAGNYGIQITDSGMMKRDGTSSWAPWHP